MAPKRNLRNLLVGCVPLLMLYGAQLYGQNGDNSSHNPELSFDKAQHVPCYRRSCFRDETIQIQLEESIFVVTNAQYDFEDGISSDSPDKVQLSSLNQHGFSSRPIIDTDKQLPSWSSGELVFQMHTQDTNGYPEDRESKTVKLFKASYKNHGLEIQSTFDDVTLNYPTQLFGHEAQEEQFDQYNPKATTFRYSQNLNKTLSFVSQWALGDKLMNMIEFRPFRKLKLEAGWGSTGDLMGEATYKFAKDWRVIAEWENEPRSSYRAEEFGSKVNYRGFGKLFQPTIGMKIKNKNYEKTNKNYTQRTFYFEMESRLNSVWSLETRFELYNKDYVTLDLTEKYFGREDTYNQFGFSAKYKTLRLEWGLDYVFKHLGSTDTDQIEANHNILLTADVMF